MVLNPHSRKAVATLMCALASGVRVISNKIATLSRVNLVLEHKLQRETKLPLSGSAGDFSKPTE